MNHLNNPHDKFFKETFSRLEVAQSFIEEVFPSDLRERLNLSSLKRINDSFTDDELEEYLADIVYQTEYAGQKTLVTLLFEHKSYVQKYPHLQLLQYILNIWKEERKQKKKLSVVIPVVIHHGEGTWKYKPIKSYFKDIHPSLERFIPEFDYLLFTLDKIEDYQIANFQNLLLSMATMLLKHSHDKEEDFLKLTSFWVEKLNRLDADKQLEFIKTVFLYIETALNLTQDNLTPIFTEVSTNVNDIAMTIADQIRISVSDKVREETFENTTFNYVKGLFQNGASIELISKSFGLSIQKVEEIIQKIKASSN
ncbi:Rpn family recombination-promoting nuclease/putative transposase [Arcicella sp. LKC2W]|uniref:Rpn family recombination-promoting nuclease/putative transposase n=1 Tax=Arcicella sp. LKC2W TaxID=2984198 RepID=UPI002B212008|nr:Rpn family recombination-promoting nuclease/putative transposase [Arcicella sp. LKC2W]MEA5460736.1 Rpn family recombination-promoting nuclease/putative transposase [Arcicella sp. LKC2W]